MESEYVGEGRCPREALPDTVSTSRIVGWDTGQGPMQQEARPRVFLSHFLCLCDAWTILTVNVCVCVYVQNVRVHVIMCECALACVCLPPHAYAYILTLSRKKRE